MNDNLKKWNGRAKTSFHAEEVSHEMYGNGKRVLEVDSVYKQGRNYQIQVYVEECKCTAAESQ